MTNLTQPQYWAGKLLQRLLVLPILAMSVSTMLGQTPNCIPNTGPIVIFDTDMGPDIDDVLALAMLHAYETNGKAKIAAVTVSRNSNIGARYCDLLNTFYYRPDIPVGKFFGSTIQDYNDGHFSAPIVNSGNYPHDVHTTGSIREGYKLMREVLAASPDNSVVIIQTGFFVNTGALLQSGPDAISPLTGVQLVAKKVKLISIMGGNNDKFPEFNVDNHIPSAQVVFSTCPVDIIQSEYDLGHAVLYPLSSIYNDFNYVSNHVVKDSYLSNDLAWHVPNGAYYNMRSWDLTSVIAALDPISNYFNLGPRGYVAVNGSSGLTTFTANPNGNVRTLGYVWDYTNAEIQNMINRMIQLTSQVPVDCSICLPAGTACDDNDPHTFNDVYDGQCTCAGVCAPVGTPCDDNDPNTANDAYDGQCNCVGNLIPGFGICQFDNPPTLDGIDHEWPQDSIFDPAIVFGGTIANQADLDASFQFAWDDNYLYAYGKITDDILINDSPGVYNDDGVELFIDGGNEKATTYDINDHQLMFRYNDPNAYQFPGAIVNPAGVDFVMVPTSVGYNIEIRISWAFIGIPSISNGGKIGFDFHINDDDDGGNRDKLLSWVDYQDLAWQNPSVFGELTFEDCQKAFISPNICLWMEGAFDPNTNRMTTRLNQMNLLPLAQPYNTAPWNYQGLESVNSFTSTTVDWVTVSFRAGTSKSSEVLATAALLQEDGCLEFPEPDFFPESLGSSFYVVVEHRNHIGVMSPTAVSVNSGVLSYDFRSGDSYSNGGQGQKNIGTGIWAMFAGDGDQLQDLNGYDINGVDNSSWLPQNGQFNVYGLGDYNLDGDISGMDKILWSGNNGVFSVLDR